jgi:hypothetical protein
MPLPPYVDLSTAFPQLIDRDLWNGEFTILTGNYSIKNLLRNGD